MKCDTGVYQSLQAWKDHKLHIDHEVRPVETDGPETGALMNLWTFISVLQEFTVTFESIRASFFLTFKVSTAAQVALSGV